MKRFIGYNFRSLESLFEEGSVMEYNVGEGDLHEKKARKSTRG